MHRQFPRLAVMIWGNTNFVREACYYCSNGHRSDQTQVEALPRCRRCYHSIPMRTMCESCQECKSNLCQFCNLNKVENSPTIPSTGDHHYIDLKRRLKAKSNKTRPHEPSNLKEWRVDDELLKVQQGQARLSLDCTGKLADHRPGNMLPSEGIQLCVHMFANTTISINVEKKDTIGKVRELIQAKLGIPPHEQHLMFQGKPLDSSHTCFYYNMQRYSTLFLLNKVENSPTIPSTGDHHYIDLPQCL